MARAPKDSSELDLWDFDGEGDLSPEPSATELPPASKLRTRSLTPEPRAVSIGDGASSVRSKKPAAKGPAQPFEQRRKISDDIGELDDDLPASEPLPAQERPVVPESKVSPPEPEPPLEPELETAIGEAVSEVAAGPVLDDESVSAEPASAAIPLNVEAIRTRLGLSKLEKIGLIALAALLVAGGIYVLTTAGKRLPIHDTSDDYPRYPVKGDRITVKSTESFWREPIAGKDTVRRDTKLIPVVKLELEGSPCAIRAFFRNEKGETIGDPVTRAISPGTVEIAATAGLEDIAFHASYRAGQTPPWRLELFEAPSTDSPRQEFKRLLDTPLANDRH
ncbi:hypothetical protein KBB96_11790 [Luteolibacter ambystomatis]|uniref:Uncharacterized protein n=1 Tax=Luteolibacter ambystomatis TaxID=2824561 RepID=A0A975G769_9BACT|nr:hypothetical protein [Luteolibacter ambystomatis]QUE49555.1 hypothetical protein KBB96_11790 [Luteolibacter ambystomatis]